MKGEIDLYLFVGGTGWSIPEETRRLRKRSSAGEKRLDPGKNKLSSSYSYLRVEKKSQTSALP